MRERKDQKSWGQLISSTEELDLILAELRQKQRPDVFSEIGSTLGWRRQPVPESLAAKVREGIREGSGGKLVNTKIFWSASLLATLMLFAVIGVLTRLGEPSALREVVRAEVGLFWLIASIGVSLFVLTTSLFVGEYLSEKSLR